MGEFVVCFSNSLYSLNDLNQQASDASHFAPNFSPDSHQVTTASADGTIRFWDLNNHSELFTLRLPTDNKHNPLFDFDFRCIPQSCWIAVPLTRGELLLYELGNIYD